jgi:hypothetical protein
MCYLHLQCRRSQFFIYTKEIGSNVTIQKTVINLDTQCCDNLKSRIKMANLYLEQKHM